MEKKEIVFENYIAEHVTAAAMNFAAGALNSTIHKVIQESGVITRNEVATIEKLYEKIITEAMEEFVPSEEELQQMKDALEKAGYKIVKDKKEPVAGGGVAGGCVAGGGVAGDTLNESADLASKIAAKLEIL